jgi:CubicO group peptidase (beta-lactamase class C family)
VHHPARARRSRAPLASPRTLARRDTHDVNGLVSTRARALHDRLPVDARHDLHAAHDEAGVRERSIDPRRRRSSVATGGAGVRAFGPALSADGPQAPARRDALALVGRAARQVVAREGLLVLAAWGYVAYDRGVLSRAAIDAIDAEALAMVERTGQPGLSLALTDGFHTLLHRTIGTADLGTRDPVRPETLFEIGSIGKAFTAMLVMQLADAGRIDVAAPVERYVSWFRVPQPADSPAITVADLLTHTAGIVAGVDATPEAAFQVWALRDLPARSAPGERFHYSNVGYKTLGLVVEAVEGRPYRELLRERILEPLGMAATEPSITDDVRARLAVGYEYLRDDRVGYRGAPLAPGTWLETDTADGSIASTAEDMCVFARLLLSGGDAPGGRLLSEGAFARMATRHAVTDAAGGYGYGLAIHHHCGHRLIGHGGGMVGYLAALQADPDAGIAAVVLQNGPAAAPSRSLAPRSPSPATAPAPSRRGPRAPTRRTSQHGAICRHTAKATRSSCAPATTASSSTPRGGKSRSRNATTACTRSPTRAGIASLWRSRVPSGRRSYGTASASTSRPEQARASRLNRRPSCARWPGITARTIPGYRSSASC